MRNKLRGTNIIRTRKVWIFEGNDTFDVITIYLDEIETTGLCEIGSLL